MRKSLILGILPVFDPVERDNQRSYLFSQSCVMSAMRLAPILLIYFLLIGGVSAQVQKPLTINELIGIALESSPQVLAARDQSKAIQ
jgi:cobalt-zinc-cadmium efflux system outer membrane protein